MENATYSRARRWGPAAVGALVLGSAMVAVTASAGGSRPTAIKAEAPPAAPIAPSLQAATPKPLTPSWLPSGVQSRGVIKTVSGALEESFTLPGLVNARTIPTEGVTIDNYREVHVETVLRVSVLPVAGNSLPVRGNPEFHSFKQVEFNGHSATLVHAHNGLGLHRVTWTSGDSQYAVSCLRLNTMDGISGLDPDDLVRVAASLGT